MTVLSAPWGRPAAALLAACSLTASASCTAGTTCPAVGAVSTLEIRLAAAWPDRDAWGVEVRCVEVAGCIEQETRPGPDRSYVVSTSAADQPVQVLVRDLSSGEVVHDEEHDAAWRTTTQPGPCGSTSTAGILVLDVRHAPA